MSEKFSSGSNKPKQTNENEIQSVLWIVVKSKWVVSSGETDKIEVPCDIRFSSINIHVSSLYGRNIADTA